MYKWAVSFVLVSGLVIGCGTASANRVYKVPESAVVRACAGQQTGTANGQFGCSRCDGGVCRDYNCSNGSGGVKKGCRETVIDRKTGPRKLKGPGHVTGVNSVGTTTAPGTVKVGHPIDTSGGRRK
jgi:hypothetical protein